MVAGRSIRIGVGLAPARGPQLGPILINGDFGNTATPPTFGSGVSISSGRANCTAAGQIVTWSNVLTIGLNYHVTLQYNSSSGSKLRVNNSATNAANIIDAESVIADSTTRSITFATFTATSVDLSIEADSAAFTGWLDNIIAVVGTGIGSSGATLPNGAFTELTAVPVFGAHVIEFTGSLSCTAAGSIATWTGVLTVGQQYSIAVGYNCTSGTNLRASNSATDGTNVVDVKALTADSTSRTLTFATFTATSADFTIGADSAVYSGTITSAVAGSAAAYSLSCTTGAFALSGQAMTPAVAMPAATGAFSLTGNAATLAHGYSLVAACGTFTLTGNAAAIEVGHVLTAATGAFALTGRAMTPAVAMSAATGVFALTGNAAGLNKVGSSTLAATTGTFALTGYAAALARAARLSATAGVFALTGTNAAFPLTRRLTGLTGAFSLTGNAAVLAARFPAIAAQFVLSGFAASGAVARRLTADPGSFVITGHDLAFIDFNPSAKTYPLAGIAQAYPGTVTAYPITTAQPYPQSSAQTYPLEGEAQQYPLAS